LIISTYSIQCKDLDNFIIGKTKEMRGQGRVGKKTAVVYQNIERRYKK
jgi:hypothetical protein